MNDKLLNKTITISDKIIKENQYGLQAKLKDEKNLTYNVYEKKQDGTTATAWTQLQQLHNGDTVQIGYIEQEKEYEGKKYIARTIRNFNTDLAQYSQTQEKPRGEANRGQSGASNGSNDAYGRRLALHGFVNALLSNGATVETIMKDLPALGRLETAIDKYLNEPQALTEMRDRFSNLPTVDVNDDLEPEYPNVEDIPF